MAVVCKKAFTYVPPSPPAYLIESTTYTLDFVTRKFLHIGIDPTENFQVAVHLITSSRHVNITPDFLKRIFSLFGNILSFILDTPRTNKRITFLDTDLFLISSMVYKGENNLVVECKNKSECRVLLNREDLIELNKLEWCISKTIIQKSVIQTILLNQIKEYCDYLEETSLQDTNPPNTEDEMEVFIKLGTPLENTTTSPNLACQIHMYAPMQLLRIWVDCRRARKTPELFTESEMRLISPLSPPQYSSMSPMYNDNGFDPSQARAADEDRGIHEFLTQINPTQVTWAPTKSLPIDDSESLPPAIIDNHSTGHDSNNFTLWYNNRVRPSSTSLAVDENDGPTSFNHSPSILGSKPTKKRNVKRKLFE
ncbi:hypothetical protein AGLY_018358 [Aphis glycines]|uniref:Uncharacterized protein n=1 Tax=Aphis glycines TaxID=307491 RepID=A0A6G0SS96_APHGL|nr:hypothetical protein AGLY_018358 [Aphis glycines]